MRGQRVTQNYFETIGVSIVRGRGFTADEAYGRAPLAAILAYHIWQNQFHGDAAAIGRVVALNGCPATIVGVAAPGFRGLEFAPHFEIGVPLEGYSRTCGAAGSLRTAALSLIGRLAPGATLTQARAEFAALGKSLQQAYPDVQRGRMPELSDIFGDGVTARCKARRRGSSCGCWAQWGF